MFAGGATGEGGGFVARKPPATMLVVRANGRWRADETMGV